MLDMALCKRCFADGGVDWSAEYEREWHEFGVVWCRAKPDGISRWLGCQKIEKPPPEDCPYLLEHVLESA